MGEFTVIIQMLLEAIFKCIEERRRENVEAGLLNPGFREYRMIIRVLRDHGEMHGRALRAEANECMAILREMDAEDIAGLCDEALEQSL